MSSSLSICGSSSAAPKCDLDRFPQLIAQGPSKEWDSLIITPMEQLLATGKVDTATLERMNEISRAMSEEIAKLQQRVLAFQNQVTYAIAPTIATHLQIGEKETLIPIDQDTLQLLKEEEGIIQNLLEDTEETPKIIPLPENDAPQNMVEHCIDLLKFVKKVRTYNPIEKMSPIELVDLLKVANYFGMPILLSTIKDHLALKICPPRPKTPAMSFEQIVAFLDHIKEYPQELVAMLIPHLSDYFLYLLLKNADYPQTFQHIVASIKSLKLSFGLKLSIAGYKEFAIEQSVFILQNLTIETIELSQLCSTDCDTVMEHASHLKNLTLQSCYISNDSLLRIANTNGPLLESIEFYGNAGSTFDGIKAFFNSTRCSCVKSIKLSSFGCSEIQSILPTLSQLSGLTSLYLTEDEMTYLEITNIRFDSFPALTNLSISQWSATENSFKNASLLHVQNLSVCCPTITDDWLEWVATQSSNLKTLDLTGTTTTIPGHKNLLEVFPKLKISGKIKSLKA